MHKFTILCITALFTSCTNQATLTIYSQPNGAYIREMAEGTGAGTAPVSFSYNKADLMKHRDQQGCYLVNGFSAYWPSGAQTASEPKVRLCDSPIGDYSISLIRNPSTPGLDKDLQLASQLEASRTMQAQMEAADHRATAAAVLSSFNSIQSTKKNINCSSYPIGNAVYTNCN